MLYRPEDFEPVTAKAWDEGGVRAAVLRIVADVEEGVPAPAAVAAATRLAGGIGASRAVPLCRRAGHCLGAGRARGRGHAESKLDPPAAAVGALEAWRASPAASPCSTTCRSASPSPWRPSRRRARRLMSAARLGLAHDLHQLVRANVDADEIDELQGIAGTLVAAAALRDRTGEERWRDACRRARRRCSPDVRWTGFDAAALQELRNLARARARGQRPGAPDHRRGRPEQAASLRAETSAAPHATPSASKVSATGRRPPGTLEHRRTGKIRLQWCHGAGNRLHHGAVPRRGAAARGRRADLGSRSAGSGEGRGICHGTVGNGYALLATFERTGDELWPTARAARRPCTRPGGAGAACLLALARRDRGRALRRRLPRRRLPLSVPRARERRLMLYQPSGTSRSTGLERAARAAIRAIVADADAAFGTESLWPANDWGLVADAVPAAEVDVGAAGVIWALDELRSRGHAEPRTDLAAAAEETLAEWRREPDLDGGGRAASTKESGSRARPASCSSPSPSRATPTLPTTSTNACARTSRARRRM